jgi:hypothetical protein
MNDGAWRIWAPELAPDEALATAVLDAHRTLAEQLARDDPLLNLNPRLPIEYRALRRIEDWRVLLLLTPWMLARLLFPDRAPDIALPTGWTAVERVGQAYQVLGPALRMRLLSQDQLAHLNYHPALGHYLLQPLCLDMEPYVEGDEVFRAWSEVIRIRDANMEQARRDCPLQKEISRRELFSRFRI